MATGVKNVIETTIHTTNCPQQYVEDFSRDLNHFTDSAHEDLKKLEESVQPIYTSDSLYMK